HRLLRVEQVGVHVHVEQVGPAAHLLQGDVQGRRVVPPLDQAAETARPGDVGPLADHHEGGAGADLERLQARELGPAARRRRPLRSTTVTETNSGSSGAAARAAAIAAFAFRVSKMVSTMSRSAPPSRRPWAAVW